MSVQIASASRAQPITHEQINSSKTLSGDQKETVNKGLDLLTSCKGNIGKLSKEDQATVKEGGKLLSRDKMLNNPKMLKDPEGREKVIDGMDAQDKRARGEPLTKDDKKAIRDGAKVLKEHDLLPRQGLISNARPGLSAITSGGPQISAGRIGTVVHGGTLARTAEGIGSPLAGLRMGTVDHGHTAGRIAEGHGPVSAEKHTGATMVSTQAVVARKAE